MTTSTAIGPREVTPTLAHRLGLAVERRARRALQRAGWVVCRSWMSRSAIDLLAVRAGATPLLVQCRTAGYVLPAERAQLLEQADRAGGAAVVVGLRDGALDWQRLTGPGAADREPLWTRCEAHGSGIVRPASVPDEELDRMTATHAAPHG
jgi:hypothetical protein